MNRLLFILLNVLVLALLIGCGSQSNSGSDSNSGQTTKVEPAKTSEQPDQKEEKKLRLGWWTDGGFPSPFAFSPKGPAGYLRVSFLYDTLAWKDDQGIQPWLAKEWVISNDEMSYTIHLREGVQWHDGKPLTASDIKFTFDYMAKHGFSWGDTGMVKAVEVKDDATAVITLNKPYSPFVEEVMGIIPIVPEHIWAGVEDPTSFRGEGAAVGTGPYTLESHNQESGQYLFKANPDYFKGKPVVDEISYITVDNRVLALKNKDIDAVMTDKYQDMQELQKAGYEVMESNPHGSIVRIVFNLDNQLLGQKEMRQAIAYALDRSKIAEKILGGNVVVGNAGIIPPGSPWYNANVKQYDFDLSKAAEMLEQMGYQDRNQDGIRETADGKKLEINLMVSSNERDGQLIQDMLKQAGIQVNLQKVDKATFTTSMGESNYDMAITGHIGVSGDPDFLRRWFTGTENNTFASRGSVLKNEDFHQLAEQQLAISDFGKRKQVVDQIQDLLAEEIPTLAVYHRPFYWVYDASKFNGWFNTWGGIANGIPLWENKAAFLANEK
jgi:peptide/nickel transport system substrate-binding protein